MTLTDRVAAFIGSERLLQPGAGVVVGLSGGADSAALLAVLSRLGYRLTAVHCHFGLRGAEADRDEAHSRALAARFGAAFRSVRFDTRAYMRQHGVSAEMACRDQRYDYFEQVRAEVGAEAVAVAHHREDNVETFFLNLLRGSGLHGLRGMMPRRDRIVRPLLETPRADLLEFLQREGIPYVVDSTNAENEFRRNRLRNVVLPLLEREFPGAAERIADSLRCLRGNEELYRSLLPEFDGRVGGVAPTLLHEWLAPYGFNSDSCRRISTAAAGAVFVSPTHRLTVCPGGTADLTPLDAPAAPKPRLTGRIVARGENFAPRRGVLYLDAGKVPDGAPWQLRPWQPGDRMRPFGMRGSRPVADLLAEAGISASRRRETWVLTLGEDIVWAVGVRASALYPVTGSTLKIIEIYHEEI